jgi:transposase
MKKKSLIPKNPTTIKSSMASIKFANKAKRGEVSSIIDEYKRIMAIYIDLLWILPVDDIPGYLDKSYLDKADSFLSYNFKQCAGKQASGIVRGTRQKQKQTLWKISDFKSKGELKKARRLQHHFDNKQVSKPTLDNVQCDLNENVAMINLNNETSFDGWVNIKTLGRDKNFSIPFKKHKHFNELYFKGHVLKSISLSKKNITFGFEIELPKQRAEGSTLGLDIGVKTTLSLSDNQAYETGNHNHTLDSICDKLCRQQPGSKNFRQTVKHRRHYLHEMANKIDLTGVKQVNREDIKGLRKGRRTSKKLGHFNYAEYFEVLDNLFLMTGVLLKKVSPTYTSQRCSACGWVLKANRKGKYFRCKSCSFELDADLNASRNLALPLRAISKKQRLKQENRIGFYWTVLSEEFTVPHPKKVNSNCALSKTQCGYQPSIT